MTAPRAPSAWPCSPLEARYGVYYDRTIEQAQATMHGDGPAPLMQDLNRIHQIVAGLGAVLRIVNGNVVVQDEYSPEDPNSMPPLSKTTEGMLTAMVAAICEQIVGDIEIRAVSYNKRVSA